MENELLDMFADANSITSEASNKVLTVKMLFDFHFCFSKTVRKNR